MSSFTLSSTINTRHNSPIDPSKSHLRSKHSESKRNEFVFRRNGKRKKSTLTRALLIASPLLFDSKIFSAHNNSNCSQHSITSQVRLSIFSSSSVETRSWVVRSESIVFDTFAHACLISHISLDSFHQRMHHVTSGMEFWCSSNPNWFFSCSVPRDTSHFQIHVATWNLTNRVITCFAMCSGPKGIVVISFFFHFFIVLRFHSHHHWNNCTIKSQRSKKSFNWLRDWMSSDVGAWCETLEKEGKNDIILRSPESIEARNTREWRRRKFFSLHRAEHFSVWLRGLIAKLLRLTVCDIVRCQFQWHRISMTELLSI